jgi:hypothetical protein
METVEAVESTDTWLPTAKRKIKNEETSTSRNTVNSDKDVHY